VFPWVQLPGAVPWFPVLQGYLGGDVGWGRTLDHPGGIRVPGMVGRGMSPGPGNAGTMLVSAFAACVEYQSRPGVAGYMGWVYSPNCCKDNCTEVNYLLLIVQPNSINYGSCRLTVTRPFFQEE